MSKFENIIGFIGMNILLLVACKLILIHDGMNLLSSWSTIALLVPVVYGLYFYIKDEIIVPVDDKRNN